MIFPLTLLLLNIAAWCLLMVFLSKRDKRLAKNRASWNWPPPPVTATPVHGLHANCPACHSGNIAPLSTFVTCFDCYHNFHRMLPPTPGFESFEIDDVGAMLDTEESIPKPSQGVALKRHKRLIVENDL